jgi:glutathione S-transferase
MTITVHSLESSRSIRVAWLLEELGLPYKVRSYRRDENLRAPPELAQIHPLGRSPVVEVDGHVLAESGAILEYFVEREQKLGPSSPEELLQYRFFLHYAEGSLMPPLLVQLLVNKLRERPLPFFVKPIAQRIANGIESGYSGPGIVLHVGFVNDELGGRPYFAGQTFTAADIQMFYGMEAALSRGQGEWPHARAWRRRVTDRAAFQRAAERVGNTIPR